MRYLLIAALATIITSGCSNKKNNDTVNGHIILGDSTTIVTETDSNYLKNEYTELSLNTDSTDMVTSDNVPEVDTAQLTSATQSAVDATSSKFFTLDLNNKSVTFDQLNTAKKVSAKIIEINEQNLPAKLILDSKTKNNKLNYRATASMTLNINGQRIPFSGNDKATTIWSKATVNGNNASVKWTNPQYQAINSRDLQQMIDRAINNSNLNTKQKKTVKQAAKNINTINDKRIEMSLKGYDVEWSGADNNGKSFNESFTINTK